MSITLRQITQDDFESVEPILRKQIEAEVYYVLPKDFSKEDLLNYWFRGPNNEAWIAEENGEILGSYYQRANYIGLGSHIANGGYVVSHNAKGKGIGRLLGEASIKRAKERGFRGIQFNFVVATNNVAVTLWRSLGFIVIGTIPSGFHYKQERYDDAFIMFKDLTRE